MSLELAMLVLNVTVLHGCNYAPMGESCAPQSDLPHWYTGQSRGYSETYTVDITPKTTLWFKAISDEYSHYLTGSWYLSGRNEPDVNWTDFYYEVNCSADFCIDSYRYAKNKSNYASLELFENAWQFMINMSNESWSRAESDGALES